MLRPPSRRPAWLLAAGLVAAHVVVNARSPYGLHRDELLYLAMGRHLRLWRMDFPPLIAMVGNLSAPLGPAPWAVRLVPALAGSALVLLVAWMARRLGASAGMQLAAALVVACGPIFFGAANLYQPVVFDQLWWTAALAALVGLRTGGDRRWWLALGVAMGLGLLTKFSIVFIGAGVGAALVLGPHRADLRTRWPWLAFLTAMVIGSPSLVGQWRLGWPVLGQMEGLREAQLARIGPLDFFAGLPLLIGPGLVLAAVGAVWLLATRESRPVREVAIAPLVALALLALGRGKSYYGAPAFPALVAAGAVALARLRVPALRRATAGVLVASSVAVAVLAAPLALPLLPPPRLVEHLRAIGFAPETNVGEPLAIPQDQADMLGWEALVDTTARVARSLSPAEREGAVVVGINYGRAGALELYGPSRALPPVVSPYGSFWFFGPGARPGDPVIVVGEDPEEPAPLFARCELAARVRNAWGVPEERDVPITLCRGARTTLQALWPSLAGRQ
ncbi:MAG TPA: glycosyltransferase family 39 protein [Gemmatimonadaceae bacterium]|nr:glycosyltransferase family 39 protein [Gemmatimonadaceae bacterium]